MGNSQSGVSKKCSKCKCEIDPEESKPYRVEGLDKKKIWKEDEKWQKILKCLDDEHSKELGLTEKDVLREIETLQKITGPTKKVACIEQEKAVKDCLLNKNCTITTCSPHIKRFLRCVACKVNQSDYNPYKDGCMEPEKNKKRFFQKKNLEP